MHKPEANGLNAHKELTITKYYFCSSLIEKWQIKAVQYEKIEKISFTSLEIFILFHVHIYIFSFA